MPDEEEAPHGDALEEFHSRTFPGYQLSPSSFRATNSRKVDALLLNAILGKKPRAMYAQQVLADVSDKGFSAAEDGATDEFRQLLEEVWFPSNRGLMKKKGKELLITHVEMGRFYRPPEGYGVDKWGRAMLWQAGVLGDSRRRQTLNDLLSRAEKRPRNLVENAILNALGTDPPADYVTADEPTRLPLEDLNEVMGQLINGLLNQATWQAAQSQEESERITMDLLCLLRTGLYLHYIRGRIEAHSFMMAFMAGSDKPPAPTKLTFGFETERSSAARGFENTRKLLEQRLEEGDYAIMALSQLHEASGWEQAKWFSDLCGPVSAAPTKAQLAWFDAYAKALQKAGVTNPAPYTPAEKPANLRELVYQMYLAISKNTRLWRSNPEERAARRYTWGAVPTMAQVDGPALFSPTSAGKGASPLINADLFLLVSRCLMSPTSRQAPFLDVVRTFERLGVHLDRPTLLAIESRLEKSGRLRKLSDAGESTYVRPD